LAGDPPPERTRTAWVVGSGGLLGSAVSRRLRTLGREVRATDVPWEHHEAAVAALVRDASALPADLEVFWCAGAGVVGTSESALDAEVDVLEGFLDRWQPGTGSQGLFLASSAGGVYAGSSGAPFTEHTVPVPISPYGHAKLRSEAVANAFAERTGTALLVGRLANLYGPGQDLTKPQGLVSQLCRAQLTRQPLNVYVSLDTRRDYLFVDDAAAMAVAGLDAVVERGGRYLKVLASERSATIGAVLGDLARITRRRPPVVLGMSATARFQARDLRFRSTEWPRVSAHARTPMLAGMAATLASVGDQMRAAQRPR
jgi:UDP-glucose 4-epimerase